MKILAWILIVPLTVIGGILYFGGTGLIDYFDL